MRSTEAVAEARRSMEICNACRYCEGFCAVFPAMELRREFTNGDLSYLANLCHDCRGCYYACQYAPPHEFGLNLPKALAELRNDTYQEYTWPRAFAVVFRRNGTVVALCTAAGIALVLALAAWFRSPDALARSYAGPEAFYRVIPEWAMIGVAAATTLFSAAALGFSAVAFWRDTGGGAAIGDGTLLAAARDVFTLRNLGGTHGCNDRDEAFSQRRRWFHQALFYGFLACIASTTVAAIYGHVLGWPAPYSFLSVPVLLGTVGGLGMVAGTAGLLWVKIVADPAPAARRLWGGDYALLVQLLLAAVTGLLLLALRDTAAMPLLLVVHLGVVLSFFMLVPYSKFVHGLYRSAALLRAARERRTQQPAAGGR